MLISITNRFSESVMARLFLEVYIKLKASEGMALVYDLLVLTSSKRCLTELYISNCTALLIS